MDRDVLTAPGVDRATSAGLIERVGPTALEFALGALLATVFVPMAVFRLVDAHEAIEMTAARLVASGLVPYHDFLYTDTPLLPYVYGLVMSATGVSWYAGRLLSAAFAIALGLALHRHVTRQTGWRGWGAVAVLLFATSGLAFPWYPLVKTHALSALLVFVAYTLVDRGAARRLVFASGLAIGLAADTRIYLLALLPVFAVLTLRRGYGGRAVGSLLGGALIALAPNVYFIARGPDVWFFDVLRLHFLAGPSPMGAWDTVRGLLSLLGIAGSFGAASLQFTLLFLAWLCSIVSALLMRERLPRSVWIILTVAVVGALPTASYGGWFHLIVPLLIAHVVTLAARVGRALSDAAADGVGRRLADVPVLLIGLYVLVAPLDAYSFTAGAEVTGTYPRAIAAHWRLPAVTRVGRAIDEERPGGGPVIAWWPGHLVDAQATVLPRLENPTALWLSPRLGPDELARYHFISHAELAGQLRAHVARVVVVGRWMRQVRAMYGDVLARSGYVVVRTVDDMDIYRWGPRQ